LKNLREIEYSYFKVLEKNLKPARPAGVEIIIVNGKLNLINHEVVIPDLSKKFEVAYNEKYLFECYDSLALQFCHPFGVWVSY
jgi:hypothetical protein